ncbi:MAG: PHP domain-containing protein [Pirellula sp.]|nr:hypothetical protein [Pirellula sp.]
MSYEILRFGTTLRCIQKVIFNTLPIKKITIACCVLFCCLTSLPLSVCVGEDAMEKLTEANLRRMREVIHRYQTERNPPPQSGPLTTVRVNFHVHSELSHDSRGKIGNIVAAAKRAKTEVLMFTEHPSQEKDFFVDGHQGIIDGVLCIPGAEMKGMLIYPTLSLTPFATAESQELTSIVRGRGGHVFLSHLEERMDWQIAGLTGTEIYNTHADFKKQVNLIKAMKNPLWFVRIASLLKDYPQEVFSALQSYPDDYLRRYDELCLLHPHAGIAANDAHENIGVQLRIGADATSIVVVDALEEELVKLPRVGVEALLSVPANAVAGDTIFKVQMDLYEYSLRHAGTYLLVEKLSQPAVWNALENGRTFVAFDWLADAQGFTLAARQQTGSCENRHEIGSQIALAKGPIRLVGKSPLPAKWVLKRNGVTEESSTGSDFKFEIRQSGVYRVELWLDGLDSPQAWILTSPFYIE